jgi:CRP-like cAMP-binding protein
VPHRDSNTPFRNCILSGLDAHDVNSLRPYLTPVDLVVRQRLETPNKPVDFVYFVETGLVSVVASGGAGTKQAEVGLIGFEGMSGLAVVNGASQSPHETVMQSDGTALSIPATTLRNLILRSTTLAMRLALYSFLFQIQTASTVLANAEGSIEQRLSRWLLMAQDRLKSDDLSLTHDTLSTMLGARRPGVTIALQRLAASGLISTERGRIFVKNRGGLETLSEGFYGIAEAEYRRIFAY